MKNICPSFVCLVAEEKHCDKYPACTGCETLNKCSFCANQENFVDGSSMPCDMIELPNACRTCLRRSSDDFAPADSCASCPHYLGMVGEKNSGPEMPL